MVFAKTRLCLGFGQFLFSRSRKIINFPKIRTQNRTIWPVSSRKNRIGFCFFGGLEWNNNLVGQEIPSRPARMNTTHEQRTGSSLYATHTHSVQKEPEGGRHGTGVASPHQKLSINSQAHGISARGLREGRQSHEAIHTRRRASRAQLQHR